MALVAIAFAVATNVVSCSSDIPNGTLLNINEVPRQTIDSMYAVQTNNGGMRMRLEASKMQRFQNDSTDTSYELFPNGFEVYAHNREGDLETYIYSDIAKHTTMGKEEKWEAFGDVVIKNFMKGQRIETDTLYWDRRKGEIYTHCFVKIYTPEGYMQGYGLRSDEMARNARILDPFDSYVILANDTLPRYLDTANFVGPFPAEMR